jgi:hypothetical protein
MTSDNTTRRFLVRDESGRGFAATLTMDDILASWSPEDIDYRPDPDDDFCESFREWMADSSAGDEYRHDELNVTVIRVD